MVSGTFSIQVYTFSIILRCNELFLLRDVGTVPQIVGSTYLTAFLMCIGCLMIRVLFMCVAV